MTVLKSIYFLLNDCLCLICSGTLTAGHLFLIHACLTQSALTQVQSLLLNTDNKELKLY